MLYPSFVVILCRIQRLGGGGGGGRRGGGGGKQVDPDEATQDESSGGYAVCKFKCFRLNRFNWR